MKLADASASQSTLRGSRPSDGRPRQHRCVNFQDGHEKGHQFRNTGLGMSIWLFRRPLIKVGDFVGSFDIDRHMRIFGSATQKLLNRPDLVNDHKNLAVECNIRYLKSNTTCPGCLIKRPPYTFACGHMLCESCVYRFRNRMISERHVVILDGCPFGCSTEKVVFKFKPRDAGVRLLALDG